MLHYFANEGMFHSV